MVDICTVGQSDIPREISRHCFFYIKEGGTIDGQVVSTDYKVSHIPSGGLEIPLLLTLFTVERERIHKMTTKNFVSDLYDYNYTGKTKEEDINGEEADNDDEENDDEVVINLED